MYGAPDVIDHAVMSLKDREEAVRRAREIWDSMYPKEPFDLDASHDSSSKKIKQFTSRLSYDLEAAIRRQRMFFYQVCALFFSVSGLGFGCKDKDRKKEKYGKTDKERKI